MTYNRIDEETRNRYNIIENGLNVSIGNPVTIELDDAHVIDFGDSYIISDKIIHIEISKDIIYLVIELIWKEEQWGYQDLPGDHLNYPEYIDIGV